MRVGDGEGNGDGDLEGLSVGDLLGSADTIFVGGGLIVGFDDPISILEKHKLQVTGHPSRTVLPLNDLSM